MVIASVPSVALSPEENQWKTSENERNEQRKKFKIVALQYVALNGSQTQDRLNIFIADAGVFLLGKQMGGSEHILDLSAI